MRKIIVIYDDSKKPGAAIRSITGEKSFGNTIFKRIPLHKHIERIVTEEDCVDSFVLKENAADRMTSDNSGMGAVLLFSDFIISDRKAFGILLEKAVYAHENYKVTCNDKQACFIFSDIKGYLSYDPAQAETYAEIECGAFTDISEIGNFRQFITSGFEARFFNSVSGDDYTVVKRSTDADKIKAEHDFYYMLPDSMKQWFVRPFDFKTGDGWASYSMERFHMADLAIRYVHGAIGEEEFRDILNRLFYFVGSRASREVSSEEYEKKASSLYIEKVIARTEKLKGTKEFAKLNTLIANLTGYSGIDAVVGEYRQLYEKIRSGRKFKNIQVVGHGDMCFSNILYSYETSTLKLIDPRGAVKEEDIYTDPYYDLAKLSHSICGKYDFFNSDLFEINVNNNLSAKLSIDFDNSGYVKLFKDKLSESGIDFKLIRLYECSLFLSMLPLHIDRPKKVLGFALNAIDIMDELKSM